MELQLWKAQETYTINGEDKLIEFSAKDMIITAIPEVVPPQYGYSIDDIDTREKLLQALDKTADEESLPLTKEGVLLLVKRFATLTLPLASKNVLKLRNDLNNLYVSFSAGHTAANR